MEYFATYLVLKLSLTILLHFTQLSIYIYFIHGAAHFKIISFYDISTVFI